jgi:hypothetical protein
MYMDIFLILGGSAAGMGTVPFTVYRFSGHTEQIYTPKEWHF